jgi:hypothetical protein
VTIEVRLPENFQARSVEDLHCFVETRLRAEIAKLRVESSVLTSAAGRCQLPNSELWYCAYRLPLTRRFAEDDYLRIQLHLGGQGMTRVGSAQLPIVAGRGCIT